MKRLNLLIVFSILNFISGICQSSIFSRQNFLKNTVSEVKIFSSDSSKHELITRHFIDDSGRLIKTFHFLRGETTTDTSYTEYYKYDSLNREIEYIIEYSENNDSDNSNYKRQVIYLNNKSILETIISKKDTSLRNISYKTRGRISKNYCNGKLFAKSIIKSKKHQDNLSMV